MPSYPTSKHTLIAHQCIKLALINTAARCIEMYSSIEDDHTQELAKHLYNFSHSVLDNPEMYLDKAISMVEYVCPTFVYRLMDGTYTIDHFAQNGNVPSTHVNLFEYTYQRDNNLSDPSDWNSNIFYHLSNYNGI